MAGMFKQQRDQNPCLKCVDELERVVIDDQHSVQAAKGFCTGRFGSFLRKVYQKCDMGLQKSKLLFLTVFCGI